MEDLNSKVLWNGYGLKKQSQTRVRTGFICKTNKGTILLKKSRGKRKNILFAHDVKETLHKNDFLNINRFIVTTENSPYYEQDNILYIVEDILPEKDLEEISIDNFNTGIKTLGEIHKKGKVTGKSNSNYDWDNSDLNTQFIKRTNELGKIKARIKKDKHKTHFDLMVLNSYDELMEQCNQAQSYLKSTNYTTLLHQCKEEGTFCHNSFKGDNIKLDDQNNIYVGGFENITRDIPIIDLNYYLKRFLRKVDGNKEDLLKLLKAYNSQNTLREQDIMFLKALAIYPEKFLRIINEHYNRRRTCLSSAMEERLSIAISEETKSQALLSYLNSISDYI